MKKIIILLVLTLSCSTLRSNGSKITPYHNEITGSQLVTANMPYLLDALRALKPYWLSGKVEIVIDDVSQPMGLESIRTLAINRVTDVMCDQVYPITRISVYTTRY